MSDWFRVYAPCPVCKRLPTIRLAAWMIEAAQTQEPEEPSMDFQCENRRCTDPNTGNRPIWTAAAHAVARAKPIEQDKAA